MKNTIMKSMVALLLLWGTAACTNEVPDDNNNQDDTRFITLQNILPDSKPSYDNGMGSRTETSTWSERDELLLKLTVGESYTTYLQLCYNNGKWSKVQGQEFTSYKVDNTATFKSDLSLVVLPDGTLNNIKIKLPEEFVGDNSVISQEWYYAPDLKWKATKTSETITSVNLALEENKSTSAPEYWTLSSGVWTTTYAKIRIKTNASSVGTLTLNTCSNFISHFPNSEYEYTATIDSDGNAYFYATSNGQKLDGTSDKIFKLTVNTSTYTIASSINKLKFEAGKSYLIDISNY